MRFNPRPYLLAVLAGLLIACGSGGNTPPGGDGLTPSPAAPSATAYPRSDAPLARLVIPAIEIDQPTVPGAVDATTNTMVAPDGPWEIAYYDYSARPGRGNAVFSGHVDFINVGPAVFWRLRDMRPGDEVILRLEDGLEMRYTVALNRTFDPVDGPWGEILAPDAAEDAVTLVTCEGFFNKETQDYSERRVVRAVRSG